MRNNDQSNRIIQWMVTIGDFLLLNAILLGFAHWHWRMGTWQTGRVEIFILVNNIALMLAMLKFSTIIHLRVIGAGEVLKRIVGLTAVQTVMAYLLLKVFAYNTPIGWLIWEIGTMFFIGLLFKRFGERWFLRLYREAGYNTRSVTLVGSDLELLAIFMKLRDDATLGYRILGYYGEESLSDVATEVDQLTKKPQKERGLLRRLGSMEDFLKAMEERPDELELGDELYLCISRKQRDTIRKVSRLCDHHVVRFYYVPVSVESIGLNLKREFLDDMEISWVSRHCCSPLYTLL